MLMEEGYSSLGSGGSYGSSRRGSGGTAEGQLTSDILAQFQESSSTTGSEDKGASRGFLRHPTASNEAAVRTIYQYVCTIINGRGLGLFFLKLIIYFFEIDFFFFFFRSKLAKCWVAVRLARYSKV
jgi:hypothetical protein